MRLQRLWRVTLFHIKQKPELIIIWAAIPVLILLSSKLGEKRINKWYLTSRWALTNHNVYSRNVLRGTIYLGYCIGLIWTTCLDLEREVFIATKTLSQLMLMSFAVFIAFEKAQDFISQSRKAYKRHCSPEASEYASIWKGD